MKIIIAMEEIISPCIEVVQVKCSKDGLLWDHTINSSIIQSQIRHIAFPYQTKHELKALFVHT